MSKVDWKPGNMVYPLPAVMVTVGDSPENYNIITVAWTGTICSDPPMCYISVRKGRYSYPVLKETGEFVINLTTKELAYATDWCGVRSGRQYDKFKEMNLTPEMAKVVKAPIIKESPVNIECKVTQVLELGTHDMFMAEVVNVKADEKYIDSESGAFSLFKAKPICYSHGNYYEVGKRIGKFGFAVEKKKRKQQYKK
ncbi:flavin reductase family protein [Saccharicrinis fermentans]|uniref:Flavoredoxin n=1 Tax=Saccharicrinis fermentans DSM 9555 = JCM 21142 TaxID=869213 RepID=W7XXX3_9BACT|nr:flavin reductase family protein [Saccharicrinis fermentans]GAF03380.1 flavoredoxin [Saccharicrinis fermentans DSM 9555 = JCM 21142]